MSITAPLSLLCLLLAQSLPIGQAQDDGYELFPTYPGSRYKVPPFRLNWTDALAACQSDGGGAHLVVMNSDREAEVVKELLARIGETSSSNVHAGISDIEVEGSWRTVTGGLVSASGYDKWIQNQPNGGIISNCGFLVTLPFYGDTTCSSVQPFICEKPVV